MTSSSDRATAGFTLFELLVAIAVIGVALALLGGFGRPQSEAREMTFAAREIAGALRAARSEALMGNRTTAVTFDFSRNAWWAGDGVPRALPRGVQVALLTDRDVTASNQVAGIRFHPDGTSSGGRVTFDGYGRAVA